MLGEFFQRLASMDPKKLMPSEQILLFASYVFLLLLLLVKIYSIPEITSNNSDYPFFRISQIVEVLQKSGQHFL